MGEQRFVALEIKNLALLQYAQTLTNMQIKYLAVLSREEFLKYFNRDIKKETEFSFFVLKYNIFIEIFDKYII